MVSENYSLNIIIYELVHVKGPENGASDELSKFRLESKTKVNVEKDEYSYVNFVEGMVPIDFWKIRSEIKKGFNFNYNAVLYCECMVKLVEDK